MIVAVEFFPGYIAVTGVMAPRLAISRNEMDFDVVKEWGAGHGRGNFERDYF
jgi:hypothetical protein